MIRIAVCDDEPAFAERVKTLIEEECRALSVSSETVLYTDSGMLAYDIGEKRYFDMLFLDIEMPGLSGMELADLIKDSLPQALVSFITSIQSTRSSPLSSPSSAIYRRRRWKAAYPWRFRMGSGCFPGR